MALKDYYRILELPPSADPDEIRKAYRRLAMIYHPDKNNNDKYAASRFAAIKEAYETLVNPSRKEEYLQQRWYAQSTGTFQPEALLSPFSILQKILYLERRLSYGDAYRISHHKYEEELSLVFDSEAIHTLNHFNETPTNDEIIRATLTCLIFLPFASQKRITKKLEIIQASSSARKRMDLFIRTQRRKHQWERQKYIWIILLTGLLCVLIYLFAD